MAVDSLMTVGAVAPDFSLKDAGGAEWRLSERRGRVVVLLFYPGDNTPICTKQLCEVRDRWTDYVSTGAEVVGISTDSGASHERFTARHELPLRLLVDTGGRVSKLYGMSSWLPGRAARGVVVIDSAGVIRYRKTEPVSLFRPKTDNILDAIRAAQQDSVER